MEVSSEVCWNLLIGFYMYERAMQE